MILELDEWYIYQRVKKLKERITRAVAETLPSLTSFDILVKKLLKAVTYPSFALLLMNTYHATVGKKMPLIHHQISRVENTFSGDNGTNDL